MPEDPHQHPENLSSRAHDMLGLISYQKDAVVSRTIVNKKTGTLTLFAFDRGQSLSEHTAPYDAVAYILDGEAEVKIGEIEIKMTKGEMVLMPADVPHALRALTQYKMLLIMIKS